jgi:hypothetical protein
MRRSYSYEPKMKTDDDEQFSNMRKITPQEYRVEKQRLRKVLYDCRSPISTDAVLTAVNGIRVKSFPSSAATAEADDKFWDVTRLLIGSKRSVDEHLNSPASWPSKQMLPCGKFEQSNAFVIQYPPKM